MNRYLPSNLAIEVRRRANDICEYCLLGQDSQEAVFHIDHIQPLSRGGTTTLENLALACVGCSLHKAARHHARDFRTGRLVPLFNPRQDAWTDHFGFTKNWRIRGRTAIGRVTAEALEMNRIALVAIRIQLAKVGRYP